MISAPQIQASMINEAQIPFVYVVTSSALAANSSGLSTLTLQADSMFELQAIMASTTEDADTDFIPNNFSVTITDQTTGRNLSNARVMQRILAGPANHLGRLWAPVIFPPQTVLNFDFLNLTANSNTVTLALVGRKIFNTQI